MVSFGHPTFCLILCEIWQKKNIRGNAGGREEVWAEGEGRRLTDGVGFGQGSSQMLGAPASNLSSLEAQLKQKKEGAREGVPGYIWRADTLRRGLGFGFGRLWMVEEEAVLAVDTFQRWKITDEWVPLVSGGEAGRDTLSGLVEVGPGLNPGLGCFGSPSASFIFFCLFAFSFSIFWFISYIFQIRSKSIQIKAWCFQIFKTMF
jgi:hypothetical protein